MSAEDTSKVPADMSWILDDRWERIEAAAVAILGGVASRGISPEQEATIFIDAVNDAEALISEIDRRRAESRE